MRILNILRYSLCALIVVVVVFIAMHGSLLQRAWEERTNPEYLVSKIADDARLIYELGNLTGFVATLVVGLIALFVPLIALYWLQEIDSTGSLVGLALSRRVTKGQGTAETPTDDPLSQLATMLVNIGQTSRSLRGPFIFTLLTIFSITLMLVIANVGFPDRPVFAYLITKLAMVAVAVLTLTLVGVIWAILVGQNSTTAKLRVLTKIMCDADVDRRRDQSPEVRCRENGTTVD